jgi:hypothetical protein
MCKSNERAAGALTFNIAGIDFICADGGLYDWDVFLSVRLPAGGYLARRQVRPPRRPVSGGSNAYMSLYRAVYNALGCDGGDGFGAALREASAAGPVHVGVIRYDGRYDGLYGGDDRGYFRGWCELIVEGGYYSPSGFNAVRSSANFFDPYFSDINAWLADAVGSAKAGVSAEEAANAAGKARIGRNARAVIEVRPDGSEVRWPSVSAAARYYKCGVSSISLCCNGYNSSAYGRVWRYEGPSGRDRRVNEYRRLGVGRLEFVREWPSAASAAAAAGVSAHDVYLSCIGRGSNPDVRYRWAD